MVKGAKRLAVDIVLEKITLAIISPALVAWVVILVTAMPFVHRVSLDHKV